MKVLLTGSSGMVGRNILDHPDSKKFEFICPKRGELNLLNKNEVEHFFKTNRIDLVIHAAGIVGGIQANIKNQAKFLLENSIIGLNIISAAFSYNVHKLINLGSSCMYPKESKNPINENQLLTGQLEPTNEGYALAKIISAKQCEYISEQNSEYFYKTIIPCNLYGKFDHFSSDRSHLLPAIILKLHRASIEGYPDVEIWGDGTARREFMYAEDLADSIFFIIKNIEKIPQYLNVGNGLDYSVLEYYMTAASVLSYSGDFKFNTNMPSGMNQKLVDSSIINSLGWFPKTNLEDGIEKTYKYFLDKEWNTN